MSRPHTKPPKRSPLQPVAGDLILHCDHAREPNFAGRTFKIGAHWFKVECKFIAPNHETGVASWLVACEPCYRASGGDVQRITVADHLAWDGDSPVIEEQSDA